MRFFSQRSAGDSTQQPVSTTGVNVDLATLIGLRQQARGLRLTPRGRVFATRSGGHLSRFRGRGMEFDEARVYQAGDDIRHMDWRVTARTGQPHVKLYREERERPVWLLIDQGPSMRFGTRVAFKSVIAAQAAALLAWSAADGGDRVGGLVFDEHSSGEFRPMARKAGVLPLIRALSDNASRGSRPGYASMSAAAREFAPQVRTGSLVFLISDFSGLTTDDGGWISQLAAGSELVFIQVFDPLEETPPPAARYPVSDEQQFSLIDTRSHAVRDAWLRHYAELRERLDEMCRRHLIHLLPLRTDQIVASTLNDKLHPAARAKVVGL